MQIADPINKIKNKLIVSCQAFPGEPLYGTKYMVAMAKSAVLGGAGGIRANGPADISAIKAAVELPVIGIYKKTYIDYEPIITPTINEVQQIINAGADIIAIDATLRVRPGNIGIKEFVKNIRNITNKPIMADISTLEEGLLAETLGLDMIGTTLSGYTTYTSGLPEDQPNIDLLESIIEQVSVPVMAEGRIWSPKQVLTVLNTGAWAVTVGGAITRPHLITRRFVKYMERTQE